MDITSFRRLAQHLQEDIGFRMLVANQTPDFLTLPDSWRHHLPAVGDLFVQVLDCVNGPVWRSWGMRRWTEPK